ncbi:MAG: cellulase family glycosylhydrolase [Leeuwenhoekiella sp.]
MKKLKFNTKSILLFLIIMTGLVACSSNNDEENSAAFDVSATLIEFDANAATNTINVTSESPWTATASGDWVHLSKSGAPKTSSITVGVQANPTAVERTVTITISNNTNSKEVKVTQAAGTEEPDPTTPTVESSIPPDEEGMRDLNSVQMTAELKVGWNLGNSLDAIGGETAWGNPVVSKTLIDAVKAAGFNAVRIPVAWSQFSDESTFTIKEEWMNRVEEVVNYVLDIDMYVIINIHWDNGWIQPTSADEEYVNDRLEKMWQQIAIHFRDYDDHLLFAGTNEVMVDGDYGTPTEEYYTVQNGYNQTFVNTVRATGGKNHYRHLVVQGFNTNIDYAVNFAEIPTDVVDNRITMEIHYYDPYNFSLSENSEITQWGKNATDPDLTETWANEDYADAQFEKMKTNFIDKGIGVIMGEYGAIARTEVAGYEEYRKYYLEYITKAASSRGVVPFYWDNGYTGNFGMGLFDRATGEIAYPEIVTAIINED